MRNLIVGAIILAGLGLVIYSLSQNAQSPEATVSESAPVEEAATEADTAEPLTGETYEISESSSVTYTAQKKFFGKPTEEVSGTTNGVRGTITLSEDGMTAALAASVPPNFFTGQSHRDNEVRDMFNGNILVGAPEIVLPESLLEDGTVSLDVDLEISINGTNKSLPFAVEVTRAGDVFTATGSGSINLRDFNLDAPSIVNVYVVDDVIEMAFEITTEA